MSFSYLGTFRQTQWKFFRQFVLKERATVAPRIAVINAELKRIGSLTVRYRTVTTNVRLSDGTVAQVPKVTEQREGLLVSTGSSLEKLLQSYIALGGNPTDISLFLRPDDVFFDGGQDPEDNPDDDPNVEANDLGIPGTRSPYPYNGVIAEVSTSGYGIGGRNPMGLTTFSRDPYYRVGRNIDLSSANQTIAIKMDFARRWTAQAIQEKRNLMEQRVLKLCDLRECLLQERDEMLIQSIGGSVEILPELPNPGQFHRGLHLTRIVSEIDDVFYVKTDGVPDLNSVNLGTGAEPQGLSLYDTLFPDDPDDDIFSTS
jgi:hypothetical protein